jgi:ribosomal protein S18 acetylase RimI-like enzyme
MLGVHPSHRRQGVAESLVSVCLERSRELGYDAVVLSSLPVQQPAHRLYERFGFRRLPERDWSPVEGVDLLAFRLEL